MIEHVYRRSTQSASLSRVYIATPDSEIEAVAKGFGAPVIMTSPDHVRATDRVAEAVSELLCDVVVNIQGDEPLIDPTALDLLCGAMEADPTLHCANLVNEFEREEDFQNPNQIKVVSTRSGDVLFMSRSPIPYGLDGQRPRLRQLGVIAFRRDFLAMFSALTPTPLERAESIDMLRAVEHGYRVQVVVSPFESFGVDTIEDLQAAEARLSNYPLGATPFGPREVGRR
jgi:3-deoxy-manno-octulosonate cytidylyltransferase (CMP-KDO synthetase)